MSHQQGEDCEDARDGACVLLSATATAARAQRACCQGPDSVSALFTPRIGEIVTATDSTEIALRRRLQLPRLGAGEVELVSDSVTCAIAAASNR